MAAVGRLVLRQRVIERAAEETLGGAGSIDFQWPLDGLLPRIAAARLD